MKALDYYKSNIEKSNIKIRELNKNIALFGWSRLLIVLLIIGSGYFFYKENKTNLLILSEVILVILGIIIVLYHNKLINKFETLKMFLEINEKGLKRVTGKFKEIEDNGAEYIEDKHPFVSDIDIFGKSSLFQLINDTITKGGRDKLVKYLKLNKLPNKIDIENRQEAIKELGSDIKWRQNLIVKGKRNFKLKKKEINELEIFLNWSKEKSNKGISKKIIAYLFIILTFSSIVFSIIGYIRPTYILLVLMINFIVIKLLTRENKEDLVVFNEIKYTIKSYAEILNMIEKKEFKSSYLLNIKSKLKNNKGSSCGEEMKKLSNLLDWIGDSVGNAYYLIINLFIFSDVFIIDNVNEWREENREYLEGWLEVISDIDALSSISNLYFDFENWNFPKILEEKEVKGKMIGHPLLGEKAVRNNYSLSNNKKVTLITGSNMSGKSTFLRTIGLNLILSYIGAPTFSEEFECGIFNVYTCMRTKDNLEENISSFYAEILRIKILIEASKRGEKVFFLLDEIFKGTNSVDRHIGATELIKQLINSGAIGLVSTHDLELCDLEKIDNRIENYNFREYYEDNKIKFDYKLRKGKSETQNAIHLMKLAGIEFN
ncbi:MAG: DNA mismatch repair protein MutS [Clostridium sp.]|nr:MutS family DNA mismatch repair protein [Clostridium sp.]MDO5039311.1 DNA mismatch repair protein MutS [Clostridium sp.]